MDLPGDGGEATGDEHAAHVVLAEPALGGRRGREAEVVEDRARQATRVMDVFHVVSWATDALDEIRREVWNDARRAGMRDLANPEGCPLRAMEEP